MRIVSFFNFNIGTKAFAGGALAALLLAIPARAIDITWTNTNSGWDNTFSWDPSVVPGASDRAIFSENAGSTSFAVGLNISNDVVGDVLFSASTKNIFWKNTTNTLTVLNSFITTQSVGSTAINTLRTGTIAVTNASGTAIVKVGDYATGNIGLLAMTRQGTVGGDTSITNYPVLIADNFSVASNSTWTFTAGTITTMGSSIDRGTSTFDIGGSAGDTTTWHILGGTNSINYIGSVGSNRLAFTAGGTCTINVSGPNTLWNVGAGAEFCIGWNGFANLTISGGAQVTNRGIASISRNGASASNSTVVVTGTGSRWNLGNELYVGRAARSNSLTISAGAVVNGTAGRIGDPVGSSNNVAIVTGANSQWNLTDLLQIGVIAPYNTLIISNGASLVSGGATASTRMGRDATSISNTAVVDGVGSQWTITSNSLVVGNSGAFNSFTVKNGAHMLTLGLTLGAGATSSNNTMLIDGSGTFWNNTNGVVFVGSAGGGNQFTLSNGAEMRTVSTFDVSPGAGSGNSALVSGGILAVTNFASGATIRVGGGSAGSFTFNGGTITADKLFLTNGANSVFTFNSGVLNVLSSQVAKASAFVVGNGSSAARLNLLGTSHTFVNGLTISSNATLSGIGTITGNVTLANGATWIPGSSAGTQTVDGAAVLNAGTVLDYELGAPADPADLIQVTGSLTLDGKINVTDLGGLANGEYVLFTYGSLTDNGLIVNSMPGSFSGTVSNDAPGQRILLVVSGGGPTDPFALWQLLYFGSTNCALCGGNADFDGDGILNTNEFLTGTNPTNSLSGLRIVTTARAGNDFKVTWNTAGGKTNIVQVSSGTGNGSYTNNFADIPASQTIVTGAGDTTTNYTDVGGATNAPSRYYRVRLVP